MFDYRDTIISQYDQSPVIGRLALNANGWFNPAADFDAFYSKVWNVADAEGYGLDVWGRIVGVGRVLQVATGDYLGLTGPDGASGDAFDAAPFYSGAPLTSNYPLSDDAFRTLIYAKALANICNGSIPAINAVLMTLFGSKGNAYATDGGDMTMTYTFTFTLDPVDFAIVTESGVIPKPAGVSVTIIQV